MQRRTYLTRFLVVAAMAALGFTPLQAQTGPSDDNRDEARARLLYAHAEGLLTNTDCWGDAAEMFERAARLFGPDHEQTFPAMLRAAQLRYYTKDYEAALSLMEEAARIGERNGRYALAASAYLDAAAFAFALKDSQAPSLLAKAVKLAKSPYLSAAERLTFEKRLGTLKVAGR